MRNSWILLAAAVAVSAVACRSPLPEAPPTPPQDARLAVYRIAPGDSLDIDVWRSESLSMTITVRPDGAISFPFVGEIVAVGKSATELAEEIRSVLEKWVPEPRVTINVSEAGSILQDQVRVIGEATNPRSIQYRRNMTVLDVLIEVGGLTEFADGNGTVLVRQEQGRETRYRVRLDDLIRDGDVSANVGVLPGDILIIPQSFL